MAATTGILQLLDRDELEGVIAHELAHVKNRDILTMTVAATVAGAISMLAQFGFFFGGGRNRDNGDGADRGAAGGDLRADGGDADPDDDQPDAGVFRRPARRGDQRQAAGAGAARCARSRPMPGASRCRAPSATRPRRRSSSSTRCPGSGWTTSSPPTRTSRTASGRWRRWPAEPAACRAPTREIRRPSPIPVVAGAEVSGSRPRGAAGGGGAGRGRARAAGAASPSRRRRRTGRSRRWRRRSGRGRRRWRRGRSGISGGSTRCSAPFLQKPPPPAAMNALRLAVAELNLDGVPAHAAVDGAVRLAQAAARGGSSPAWSTRWRGGWPRAARRSGRRRRRRALPGWLAEPVGGGLGAGGGGGDRRGAPAARRRST